MRTAAYLLCIRSERFFKTLARAHRCSDAVVHFSWTGIALIPTYPVSCEGSDKWWNGRGGWTEHLGMIGNVDASAPRRPLYDCKPEYGYNKVGNYADYKY